MGAGERCAPDDEAGVEQECREQLEAFRALLGRDPTHLDSHHHVHMSEPIASVAAGLAGELGVPLRAGAIRYEGGFYARAKRASRSRRGSRSRVWSS